MKFEDCLKYIIAKEGGSKYTNDPDDPGGETNLGINKRDHPNEDIKNMTRERAAEIYRKEYWDRVRGDSLPWPMDLVVMDAAVNCGPTRALE